MSYDERRREITLLRIGGAPARSAAAWLSMVDIAEREGRPVPAWDELERVAPSISTAGDDDEAEREFLKPIR